jgi:hypothetical protein
MILLARQMRLERGGCLGAAECCWLAKFGQRQIPRYKSLHPTCQFSQKPSCMKLSLEVSLLLCISVSLSQDEHDIIHSSPLPSYASTKNTFRLQEICRTIARNSNDRSLQQSYQAASERESSIRHREKSAG